MGKRKSRFELPLAFVVWDDAYSNDDWTNLEEIKGHDPCINESIGFLADESDKHITLLMTVASGNAPDRICATRLTIPKPYIVTMETIMGNGRWKKVIDTTEKPKEDEDTQPNL